MAITLTDKQAKDVRDLLYLGLQEIDDKIDLADHYGELTTADHRRLFDEYAAAEVTLCLLTGNTPERHGCEDEKFVELDARAISDAANTIAVRILKGVALEAAKPKPIIVYLDESSIPEIVLNIPKGVVVEIRDCSAYEHTSEFFAEDEEDGRAGSDGLRQYTITRWGNTDNVGYREG